MESWRKVWREGFASQLSDSSVEALRLALLQDDPRLLQGATTLPPPLQCVQDWPVEAGCVLGFCGAIENGGFGKDGATVQQAEQFFAEKCFEADRLLGEPAACRHFLNFFDETPRDEMRRLLLSEVNREQARRNARGNSDVDDGLHQRSAEETGHAVRLHS